MATELKARSIFMPSARLYSFFLWATTGVCSIGQEAVVEEPLDIGEVKHDVAFTLALHELYHLCLDNGYQQ